MVGNMLRKNIVPVGIALIIVVAFVLRIENQRELARIALSSCDRQNTILKILHDEHTTKLADIDRVLLHNDTGVSITRATLLRARANEQLIVNQTNPINCNP